MNRQFWSRVYKTKTCWFWIGSVGNHGYGVLGKNKLLAHRISWRLHFGSIRKSQWVLHRCDTPQCVNPKHLFVGTQKQNMADASAKGTAGLFAKHVSQEYGVSLRELSRSVGVPYSTLYWRFIRGKNLL